MNGKFVSYFNTDRDSRFMLMISIRKLSGLCSNKAVYCRDTFGRNNEAVCTVECAVCRTEKIKVRLCCVGSVLLVTSWYYCFRTKDDLTFFRGMLYSPVWSSWLRVAAITPFLTILLQSMSLKGRGGSSSPLPPSTRSPRSSPALQPTIIQLLVCSTLVLRSVRSCAKSVGLNVIININIYF